MTKYERYRDYYERLNRERRSDPAFGEYERDYKKAWRKRNAAKLRQQDKDRYSAKTRAQQVVRNRIYRGSASRGLCAFCGSAPTDAHHQDYRKPLEVVWVCRTHHQAIHKGIVNVREDHITRL